MLENENNVKAGYVASRWQPVKRPCAMTCVQHLMTPRTPTTCCQRSGRSPRGVRGSLRPYCGSRSRFDGGRGQRLWRQGRVGRSGGRRDRTRGSAEGTRTSVAGGFARKYQRTKRHALAFCPGELNPGSPISCRTQPWFPDRSLSRCTVSSRATPPTDRS